MISREDLKKDPNWKKVEKTLDKHAVSSSDLSAVLKAGVVFKAIQDEPEYPGEIPDKLWDYLKTAISADDKDLVMFVFRQIVKDTKRGIIERLGI